jgi:hypothetical protein
MNSRANLGRVAGKVAAFTLAAVVFVTSAGAATPASSSLTASAPPVTNVNVVNTPAVTVSNTPTVNVGNTPTVNVGNTPTVNVGSMPAVMISGTPTVNFGNTSTTPVFTRDADNPALQPVNYSATVSVPDMSQSFAADIATVPMGKRLVIETISYYGVVAPGETGYVQFFATTGNSQVNHTIPSQKLFSQGTADRIGGIAAARMYADGGTTITAGFFRGASTGSESVNVNVTGYLVNIP